MMPNYMQVRGLARALRPRSALAARRGRAQRSAALGARSRCAACAGNEPHAGDPDLQPEQPDRRPAHRGRAGRDLRHRRRLRRVGPVGRDLPRRGARRRRNADGLGPLRARDRHARPVQGLRAARPADRLGRRAAGAGRGAVGRPRLHDDRARRDQRSAGANRARAARGASCCSRGRAASSAPTTRPCRRWIERRAATLTHIAAGGRRDRVRPLPHAHRLDAA